MEQENTEDDFGNESDSSESVEDDSDSEAHKKSSESSRNNKEETINNQFKDHRDTNRSLNNSEDPCVAMVSKFKFVLYGCIKKK